MPFPRGFRLAVAAAMVLGACSLVLFLAVGDLNADIDTLRVLETDNPVSAEEIELNHFRLRWLVVLIGGSSAVSAALWLAWQYAAYANLRAQGVSGLRFSSLGGIWTWLVPGANLVLPPLVMRELYRAGDPFGPGGDWRRARTTPVLWLWWLAFVGAIALAVRALAPAAHTGATLAERILRDQRLMSVCWVGAAAGVSAVVLILSISRRPRLREESAGPRDWRWPGDRRAR
jgi:hypothetical protein